MPTFSWMFVIIILSLTEGTTFSKRQNKKCEAVVMCPQFCLKIKDECYICECKKSMNSFMQGAIQQMKHDYDPIYQTGSKFVNLNMGTKDETNKIQEQNPNIRKSPWINMGNFEANTFGGVMMGGVESVSQTGHYLEPNFKVAMVLPGRCPEMSYACPGRCWKTDGFSGCFRCECEDKQSTPLPPSSFQTTTIASYGEQITSNVPTTKPKVTLEQMTKQTVTSSSVTPTQQTASKSVNLQHIKGSIEETTTEMGPPTPTATKEFIPQNLNSHSVDKNTNAVEKNTVLEQLNSVLNMSSGMTLTSKFTNGQGSNPSTGSSLVDLTGADLFKILITGIKEHKSLQEVLYSLAAKVNKGHNEESFAGQGHQIEKSEGQIKPEKILLLNSSISDKNVAGASAAELTSNFQKIVEIRPSDVTTTNKPTESNREDCLDLGSSCPADCHVTDPVSKCPVCSCAEHQNEIHKSAISCVPLDVRCPSRCITLDSSMCPVCVCTDTQTDQASTQPTPTTSAKHDTTSSATNSVCRITEKVRNCASSCLKLDDHFCPVCICSDDVTKGTKSSNNICPAVERGCPQRCLKFDQNYCAYCFCDT
ncbi:uncharacterized protein [Magallana gigas]|uniref:uncharacterized protein isoform X2 n=1 Tax=Magallana gigas TaxID=29159 RepID=UPI00333E33AD